MPLKTFPSPAITRSPTNLSLCLTFLTWYLSGDFIFHFRNVTTSSSFPTFLFSASPCFYIIHPSSGSLICALWIEKFSLCSYSQDEEKWLGKYFTASSPLARSDNISYIRVHLWKDPGLCEPRLGICIGKQSAPFLPCLKKAFQPGRHTQSDG